MVHSLLSAGALSVLLQVVVIDLVLAGDNAVAVGVVAASLPPDQRRRVILWGLVTAVVVRIGFAIMKYQVSADAYAACVADGACETADGRTSGDVPVTGVSHRDAEAYAAWLSRRTGEVWRLPTDEEWSFAAAERLHDDALGLADDGNPATRWLARYRSEAAGKADRDPQPKPLGHFGAYPAAAE